LLLELLVQRLFFDIAIAVEFSRIANQFAIKMWLFWILPVEKSEWVILDGPDQLGYNLIQAAQEKQEKKEDQLVNLSEYQQLLQIREANLATEGKEAIKNRWTINWAN